MSNLTVRVFPKGDEPPIDFESVDKLSFVTDESYGPSRSFGIDEDFEGVALLVNAGAVQAVEVEA